MSATRPGSGTDAAGDLAGAVRGAEFVALVAAADGDALAAAGLLARGCRAAGVPFRASVARTAPERERRLAGEADALAVAAGADAASGEAAGTDAASGEAAGTDAASGEAAGTDAAGAGTAGADRTVAATAERPASVLAHDVATELGAEPAPVAALAGAFAAGVDPGAGPTAGLLETARDAGAVERRPGVATPVADPADGLAHGTLVHADFAGRPDAAAALAADAGLEPTAADPDEELRRELASLVALEAAGDERATPRAADAVERALRPYATPGGPFATVGGHADVLAAVAREAPGTGVALALSGDVREAALSAWRDHGRAAHAAVRAATTARYDGLFVARLDEPAPVETVARLVLSARSPEPAVLAVGDDEAAAVAAPDADLDAGAAARAAVGAVGGAAGGDAARAYARHDAETRAFISAFREGTE